MRWGLPASPGPWRVFPLFLVHSQIPTATRAIRMATPLIVPPIIAPVLSMPPEDGSGVFELGMEVTVEDVADDVLELVELCIEEEVDEVVIELEEVVVVDRDAVVVVMEGVALDLVNGRVPVVGLMLVGVFKIVWLSVKGTERLEMSRGLV
jgi:hypothetical protein